MPDIVNPGERVAICHPDPDPSPRGHCQVSITRWDAQPDEQDPPTVDDPGYHLRYRSYCDGCGHHGPTRSEENQAVEDGCDHAYPGWRTMPVLEHRPYDPKRLARWKEAARSVYPPGWFERQGPVREYRSPIATRHVLGLAPGGGYCMAVVLPHTTTPKPAVQQSLFD